MEQLQHLTDKAAAAADRWGKTLKQIAAQQRALGADPTWRNLGISMEAAANAGFNSFNSAFTKMLAGGMSFTTLMQTAWTSMVGTFITLILKMAEKWILKHLLMAAAQKVLAA